MAVMRKTLAAICVLTLLATAYLSASLIILRPPRANVTMWCAVASAIAAQSLLTIAVLRRPRGMPMRTLAVAAVAAGAALAAAGVWMVRSTLTSSHFEGYALLLGAMLLLQGALTVSVFARRLRGGSPVRIA
jgi:hypothetical protein